MKRLLLPAVLVLASACGQSANVAPEQPPAFRSLLSKYAGEELVSGLTLPDATDYWTGAEARNGNAFPIKAEPGQPEVLEVRLAADGTLATLENSKPVPQTLASLREKLQPLVQENMIADLGVSSAAVLLAADIGAPWEVLAQICMTCVRSKVGNLWLATRDTRDGACRLLKLQLDMEREQDPWYGYVRDVAPGAVRLEFHSGLPVLRVKGDRRFEFKSAEGWGKPLGHAASQLSPRPRRLQLAFARGAQVGALQQALQQLSDAAFAEIEPVWPLAEETPLPEATTFWRHHAGRPVTLDYVEDTQSAVFARLDAAGRMATFDGLRWQASGLAGTRTLIQRAADGSRDADGLARCAVIVLADPAGPWQGIMELCRACAELSAPRLYLATRKSDVFAELLPLRVDPSLAQQLKYVVADSDREKLMELNWTGNVPSFFFGDGAQYKAADATGWNNALRGAVEKRTPRPTRMILNIAPDATLQRLEEVLAKSAVAAFSEIEPFWFSLRQQEGSTPARFSRVLHEYSDRIDAPATVALPTLSEYWRTSETAARMPGAAKLDEESPRLYLSVDAKGAWSHRDGATWVPHADDAKVAELVALHAGAVGDEDFSKLQIVLAADRGAPWVHVLGLMEMMVRSRVRGLYLLTHDALGPTPRLLDLSLPVAPDPDDEAPTLARLKLVREGPIAEGQYNSTLTVSGHEPVNAQGPRFLATLSGQAKEYSGGAQVLLVSMPGDEPLQTYLSLLNALARLEPARLQVAP